LYIRASVYIVLFEKAPYAATLEDWEKLLPWNINFSVKTAAFPYYQDAVWTVTRKVSKSPRVVTN